MVENDFAENTCSEDGSLKKRGREGGSKRVGVKYEGMVSRVSILSNKTS